MTLNKFLRAIYEFMHPVRVRLQAENDYLKAQVAYQQRRGDELQARLIALLMPTQRIERKPPPAFNPTKTGWDSYRAAKRGETDDSSQEAAQGNAPAVTAAS